MADFRINIVVDPSGARRGARAVERSLDRVEQRADRTRELLSRAFAFIGVGAGIQQLTTLVNTFDNLQNRLRTVTNSTSELAAVNQELFEISQRTRSSFEGSVELFARVARSTQRLGVSQQQTLQFTESLNQAILLSGATAQEAQAGLIQLSQGLASGALRGDELRSVLEQLPEVADVIAQSLNVTRGELRELGAQGQITAQVVLDAFAQASDDLQARFDQLVPTIDQAFTVLRNNFLQLIGGFSQSIGLSRTLSQAILLLSDNLETLARVAAAAGIALSIQLARVGIGSVITAIRTLTVAIAANPLGAFLVAVTAGISLLVAFSDQITLGGDRIANLQDLAVATFEAIGEAIQPLIDVVRSGLDIIITAFESVFGEVEFSLEGILTTAARVVDGIVGFFRGLATAILVSIDIAVTRTRDSFIALFNFLSRAATGFINGLIRSYNVAAEFIGAALIEPIEAFQLEAPQGARLAGEDIGRAFFEGIQSQTAAQDAISGILDRAEEIAQRRTAEQAQRSAELQAAQAALASLPDPAQLAGVAGAGVAGTPTDPVQQIEAVNNALVQQEGILERVKLQFTDVGSTIESALTNAFQNGENALVDFLTTGEFEFKSFTDSILKDLARIAVRQTITAGIAGLFPGAGAAGPLLSAGGGGGGGGLIPGFQTGGSFQVGGAGGVDRNVLSLNNQPVARVSKGETVNVSPNGGNNGGRPIQINFNIATPDAESFQRSQDQILARTQAALARASKRNN